MSNLIHKMMKQAERAQDLHQKEREVLFENETLAVKILQAVSGAAMIGGLTQAETLIRLAGRVSFLVFLTAMGLALVAAVFTAHWKHQYKMWHVKGLAERNKEQRIRRFERSNSYLSAMRAGMWVSLLLIATGFLQLLIFLWTVGSIGQESTVAIESKMPANPTIERDARENGARPSL